MSSNVHVVPPAAHTVCCADILHKLGSTKPPQTSELMFSVNTFFGSKESKKCKRTKKKHKSLEVYFWKRRRYEMIVRQFYVFH